MSDLSDPPEVGSPAEALRLLEALERLEILGRRYVLRMVGRDDGPTPFDGLYVKAYDPSFWLADEKYDGGRLEVTANPLEALYFPDIGAALEKWREPFGVRADGQPNRPLTAFHCEAISLATALKEAG